MRRQKGKKRKTEEKERGEGRGRDRGKAKERKESKRIKERKEIKNNWSQDGWKRDVPLPSSLTLCPFPLLQNVSAIASVGEDICLQDFEKEELVIVNAEGRRLVVLQPSHSWAQGKIAACPETELVYSCGLGPASSSANNAQLDIFCPRASQKPISIISLPGLSLNLQTWSVSNEIIMWRDLVDVVSLFDSTGRLHQRFKWEGDGGWAKDTMLMLNSSEFLHFVYPCSVLGSGTVWEIHSGSFLQRCSLPPLLWRDACYTRSSESLSVLTQGQIWETDLQGKPRSIFDFSMLPGTKALRFSKMPQGFVVLQSQTPQIFKF